jgi:hypothetical protein
MEHPFENKSDNGPTTTPLPFENQESWWKFTFQKVLDLPLFTGFDTNCTPLARDNWKLKLGH